jgi:hypothetical protein
MATDFALSLRRFFIDHLAGLRGCSPHTISSYRDAFKLLICWFRDERQVPPERLTLEHLDAAAITGFLAWLRTERHNSPSTCNHRLAAISSFFRWLQTQDPARMACCQDILQVPSSKHNQPAIAHLTVEQTRQLLCATRRPVVSPAQPGGTQGRFLGPMAYPDPKGDRNNSMPANRRSCPGVRGDAPRDPRDMAKAGLPEAQSPEDAKIRPPEGHPKPAPRSATASRAGRRNLGAWSVAQ